MSIEVEVPVEIEDYKEKIIFGLSLRQLACMTIAIALCVVSYLFCTKVLGWTMDSTGYVIIIEAMPFMAVGFVTKDGMPFEKYARLMIRHCLGSNKLPTAILLEEEEQERNYQNGAKGAKNPRREAEIFVPNKKTTKKCRKAARQTLKAAQKEHRAAERAAKKAGSTAEST